MKSNACWCPPSFCTDTFYRESSPWLLQWRRHFKVSPQPMECLKGSRAKKKKKDPWPEQTTETTQQKPNVIFAWKPINLPYLNNFQHTSICGFPAERAQPFNLENSFCIWANSSNKSRVRVQNGNVPSAPFYNVSSYMCDCCMKLSYWFHLTGSS